MTLAVNKMDVNGHINTARREPLPRKTKVMSCWLQKDYWKDTVLHLLKWVGECVVMLLKEGQSSVSQ